MKVATRTQAEDLESLTITIQLPGKTVALLKRAAKAGGYTIEAHASHWLWVGLTTTAQWMAEELDERARFRAKLTRRRRKPSKKSSNGR